MVKIGDHVQLFEGKGTVVSKEGIYSKVKYDHVYGDGYKETVAIESQMEVIPW